VLADAQSGKRAQCHGLNPERAEIAADRAHRPAHALADIVLDCPVIFEVGGADDPARGCIGRAGQVDRGDDNVGEIGIDLEERKEPPFEIAQIALETRKEIADPGLESGRNRVADGGPRRAGGVAPAAHGADIARQQLRG
jgi:hypothetical protein